MKVKDLKCPKCGDHDELIIYAWNELDDIAQLSLECVKCKKFWEVLEDKIVEEEL